MTEPESAMRPAHVAVLLLASGESLPRARARDQQADLAGSHIKQELLRRLISIDPDVERLVATLDSLVADLGEPTGPTRAIARMIVDEWNAIRRTPTLGSWLLDETMRVNKESRE